MKQCRIVFLQAFVLLVVFLVPQAQAQTTAAQNSQSPSQSPTIITTVDEVTLDLVVRDKRNKPVLNLKPADVSVTDGGTPVKLSDLRLVTGTNAEHLITMVFDRLEPSAAKNARDIATKILKIVSPSQFSFSVLDVGGRLRLIQGFTSDPAALAKAIAAATENEKEKERGTSAAEDPAVLPEKNLIATAQTGKDSSGHVVNSKERDSARIMLASIEESQRIVQDQHCRPALAGLLALARIQRQFTGRKVVIFFAQGLNGDLNTRDMVRSITGTANKSGVSIYAIDANPTDENAIQGLIASVAIGGAGASIRANSVSGPAGSGTALSPTPQLPGGMQAQISDTIDQVEAEGLSGYKSPMAELAEKSGGAYITATDSLKKPLQQMVEDANTFYEVSYVPPIQEYDGKFRPVAVTPVRPGLHIRSKAGYFAVPPDAGYGVKPFEAPLLKLFSESQLPTDLKFQAAILRLGDQPTGNENALVVEVPVSALETRDDPNSNLYSLHVSILAQVKNKAGEVIEHFSEDIPRHGSLDSKASAQSEVITMQRHFVAEPGTYTLETAILDRNNQKVAAQRQEFEIPPPSAGPSLSDVALVQRVLPLPEEMDSVEPLQYGKHKVVPGISGRVPHGAKEISFFFVVHPDPTSTEQPTLEMEVLKNNESIAQVPLKLRKADGPASIPYLASVQAGSLPGGEYQVIEKLTQGGKTSERSLTFRIEGPELASATTPASVAAAEKAQADDIEISAVSGPQESEPNGHKGRLVITELPAGSVPAPSAEQMDTIVAGARKRALDYAKALPNFICAEVTNRSVDQSGKGNWKHRDSIVELLTYHDGHQTLQTLEVDGKRSSLKRADMNSQWPISVGEFGALLNLVFDPASKTQFEWKEAGTLGDGTGALQILTYRVARENATIDLNEGGNHTIGVGFHGLVYIDAATSGVRRITLEADDLPRDFSMHAVAMTVDYDYVAISGRDYLLPVHSTVTLQRHRRQIEMNEIAFRNYRRFASRAKIKMIQ